MATASGRAGAARKGKRWHGDCPIGRRRPRPQPFARLAERVPRSRRGRHAAGERPSLASRFRRPRRRMGLGASGAAAERRGRKERRRLRSGAGRKDGRRVEAAKAARSHQATPRTLGRDEGSAEGTWLRSARRTACADESAPGGRNAGRPAWAGRERKPCAGLSGAGFPRFGKPAPRPRGGRGALRYGAGLNSTSAPFGREYPQTWPRR